MRKSRILLLVALFVVGFAFSRVPMIKAEDEGGMMNAEMKGDAAMPEVAMKGDCPICSMHSMDVEGKDEFQTEYKGKIYKFESEEHKNMFLAEPEKYAEKADEGMKADEKAGAMTEGTK